jgi:hypothetical protein
MNENKTKVLVSYYTYGTGSMFDVIRVYDEQNFNEAQKDLEMLEKYSKENFRQYELRNCENTLS